MKLYIDEGHPSPRLFLSVPDVQPLILKAGGGEGSRGGQVIGHTPSGKPIYQHRMSIGAGESYQSALTKYRDKLDEAHSNFTAQDHDHAAAHYRKLANTSVDEDDKEYDQHMWAASEHKKLANEKAKMRVRSAADDDAKKSLYLDLNKGGDPSAHARKHDGTNKEYPKSEADLADDRHEPGLYLALHKGVLSGAVASKSIYGEDDDWLLNFQGTDLFEQAVALCEKELDLREKQLSSYNKAPQPDPLWQDMDKLRLDKQRLVLRLAKQRNAKAKKFENAMKANPHRDPSVGQYIAGGGGAAKGKGQTDLSGKVDELMKEKAS